jgi:hypothetical protein
MGKHLKPHKHGLPAKLCSLAPGEFLILPDPNQNMDRQLQTIKLRSQFLKDMEFDVNRMRYIEGDRLLPAVKIRRRII